MPPEVTAYVTDGSLVVRLDELYGLDASGDGIDFDETTKPGPISRVWVWTAEVYSGEPIEHPVELTNNWVVPITIGDEPAGIATVWINPELEAPELAEFDADPEAAVALAAVPEAAQLVRDDVSDSWFALQDGILTPLVPGRSGLETPTPLDEVALVMPEGPEPADTGESQPGLVLAIGVLVLLVLVIGVSLFVSSRRGKPAVGDDLSSPAP